MHHSAFSGLDNQKRDTYDSLKEEYDSVISDIYRVNRIPTSEESKVKMLEELEQQKNEIKERMHNYIDTL